MAELTISSDDIQGAIEEYVSSFSADTAREEVGTVIDAGDGIAHVEGLPSVMTQELLEFPGGVLGVALNLDEHSVGAVILTSGTLTTSGIVNAQSRFVDWNIIATGFVPFVIFLIAAIAELNRPPFDFVEADCDLTLTPLDAAGSAPVFEDEPPGVAVADRSFRC